MNTLVMSSKQSERDKQSERENQSERQSMTGKATETALEVQRNTKQQAAREVRQQQCDARTLTATLSLNSETACGVCTI